MTRMWLFAARAAIAASYLTLAVADLDTAADLAGPYAALVLIVAVSDLYAARRSHARPPH